MADLFDLLIIGGGITGQCAALTAAVAGAKVGIVDFGQNAGSHANAGSLHVQLQSRFLRLNPHLAENVESSLPLYLAAVQEWEALDTQLGGVELSREGGLMLAESADQMVFLRQKAEREARKGLAVDILERDALGRIAPYLGPSIVGAELCHDEGKLNPLIANKKLNARLGELGVRQIADRIDRIDIEPGKPAAIGQTRYEASHILIAAAWGTEVLTEGLGLRLPTPPEPLHMNITEPGEYAIKHLVQHAERSITLKQFRSGQVVIGGGWPAQQEHAEATPRVRSDSFLGNVALAAAIAPGIAQLRILRTWAGVNTPVDGKATIGPIRPGAPVSLALPGDAGYTLGPIVGRCAAEMILGMPTQIDPEPYSPSRWAA
ncbi:MAG: FAD-binding oxidoreductase [Pseudomonadota bacterium]